MKKKVIAFDLDGTLAVTKSPIEDRMSELLDRLLEKYQVCIMSGGKFEQFEKQLLSNLKAGEQQLQSLHLMPTCGTRYYRFDPQKRNWQQVYAEDLTPAQKQKITAALKEGINKLGYHPAKLWGNQIEDRGSQITISILGQLAPPKEKIAWDPGGEKKQKLRDYVAALIPEFEVRVGGTTSVDVTKLGIDKAYGMRKLLNMLSISKEQVIFIGDRLQEGGNDYPVKAMGIDCREISNWQETALVIEGILDVS